MANTRQSTKRARQADKRQARNLRVRSTTRSALRIAIEAVKSQDLSKAQAAYKAAVKAVAKAASKGSIPKSRAARKISRLTLLIKKAAPSLLKQQ